MYPLQVDESDKSSEHFVGETAALNRRLRRTKGAKFPILYNFQDEDELFDAENQLQQSSNQENSIISARVSYQKFWGRKKYFQIKSCIDSGHYNPCLSTNRRDWSCGICHSGEFKCRCDSGVKELSPYRLVFWNSQIAYNTRNTIYTIGLGLYLPKTHPESAPDWRTIQW
jgi:hypothetical protein